MDIAAFLKMVFEDYWPQISLLLLGIGYLIKSAISHSSKKKEIAYSYFQQNKMAAISNFMNCYSEAISMIDNIPEFQIYHREMSAEEIDNYVQPTITRLNRANDELQVYLDSNTRSMFKAATEGIHRINAEMIDLRVNKSGSWTGTQMSIQFHAVKDMNIKLNESVLSDALSAIRSEYD